MSRPPEPRARPRAACTFALAAWLGASGAAADECAPWPHEPEPLPTVTAAEPLAALWARLRAEELAQAARAFESAGQRNPAHRLWRHVGCVDPQRPGLSDALSRTRPVRALSPAVARVAVRPAVAPARDVESAVALLRGPILIELPPPAQAPDEAPATPETLAEAVAALEAQVRQARFEEALEAAERLRADLAREDAPPSLRARLEVAAATAALALGRDDEAEASFRRALHAAPDLALDPERTSPKVLRALERVRGSAS